MPTKNKKGALSILGTFILAVFLVIVLSNYFKIDLKAELESEQAQSVITEARGGILGLWDNYLKIPVTYLWYAFLNNMQRIHDGQPTDLDLAAPTVRMPYQGN